MNILIFRSIRPEEMGYVINDIKTLYQTKIKIFVITNYQQSFSMRNIEGVSEILIYSGKNFNTYKNKENEIKDFKKNFYSKIIIPTNGNIDSYKNVYNFAKKNFNSNDINFYIYPKKLITINDNYIFIIYKKIMFIISLIIALPISLISLFLIYIRSFFR